MIRLAGGIPAPWRDALDGIHEAVRLARESATESAVPADDAFGLLAVDGAATDLTVAPREEVDAAQRGDAPYPRRLDRLRSICRLTQPHSVLIGSRRVASLDALAGRVASLAVAEGFDARIVNALLARCGVAARRTDDDATADLLAWILRPHLAPPAWAADGRLFDAPRDGADRAMRDLGVRTGTLRAGTFPFVARDIVVFRLTDHVVVTHVGFDREAAARVVRALDEHPAALASTSTGFGFHPASAWRETAVPVHVGAMAYARERGHLR
ncbi:MAG TPA: hypothetical protein VFM93_00085 [Candidatus Limnocylindria bacterium]|nr:hypothetical protein [Candidatus Limnocylindria bacterium]